MKPEKLNLRKLPKNTKLQLFVRWDKSGFSMTGGGKVELQADGKVVFSSSNCGNDDRLYGYCKAFVEILTRLGHDIRMPRCMMGHICADKSRED